MTIIEASPETTADIMYQLAAGSAGWYAARASGLHRSTDNGASWQPAYTSLGATEELATFCVTTVVDSQLVFAGLSGELLRSDDGGATWEILPRPSPAPVFTALVPSPAYANDNTLFAGTLEDGVLIYSGNTWAMWNFGLLDTNVLCLAVSPAFAEDRAVFAGVQSGLFRSINGGQSWAELDLGIGYGAVLCLALSPDFAVDGVAYAGVEDGGLLRSTNGGASWQRVGADILTGSISSIVIDTSNSMPPTLLVLHDDHMLASSDNGESWQLWRAEHLADLEVTVVLAPHGLGAGAPALVGLADGALRVV